MQCRELAGCIAARLLPHARAALPCLRLSAVPARRTLYLRVALVRPFLLRALRFGDAVSRAPAGKMPSLACAAANSSSDGSVVSADSLAAFRFAPPPYLASSAAKSALADTSRCAQRCRVYVQHSVCVCVVNVRTRGECAPVYGEWARAW
eukprot:363362-Chlamydomonas_euryale.AAC.2